MMLLTTHGLTGTGPVTHGNWSREFLNRRFISKIFGCVKKKV